MSIVIIDYGMGNLGSIHNMFKKIGVDSRISAMPADIATASRLVLPGVGAFDAGMDNLAQTGLVPLLNEKVMQHKTPILGICLGMQLMTCRSAEGERSGLGWVNAEARRFEMTDPGLRVPHMGWNVVTSTRSSVLLEGLPEESRFYFVHSYFVHCNEESDVLLTTPYGRAFHSAFQSGNVFGVQFHPEKSHKFGMALLRNFATRVN